MEIGDAGIGNVIGNNGAGLEIREAVNEVIGNHVGTGPQGEDFGNDDFGVAIADTQITVGAAAGSSATDAASRANAIAYNGGRGIVVRLDDRVALRGNTLFENADLGIDLGNDGATPNDVDDVDIGANNLQNFPEFDPLQTLYNEVTGQLEVRYRVRSNLSDAAYPLDVDFYLRTDSTAEADVYVGADSYPAASATLYRAVAIDPPAGVEVAGALVATATERGRKYERAVARVRLRAGA